MGEGFQRWHTLIFREQWKEVGLEWIRAFFFHFLHLCTPVQDTWASAYRSRRLRTAMQNKNNNSFLVFPSGREWDLLPLPLSSIVCGDIVAHTPREEPPWLLASAVKPHP